MVHEQPEVPRENYPHRASSDYEVLVDNQDQEQASDDPALLKQKASVVPIVEKVRHDRIFFSSAPLDVDQRHQSIEDVEHQDRYKDSGVALAIEVDKAVLIFPFPTSPFSSLEPERVSPH